MSVAQDQHAALNNVTADAVNASKTIEPALVGLPYLVDPVDRECDVADALQEYSLHFFLQVIARYHRADLVVGNASGRGGACGEITMSASSHATRS